MLRREIDVRYHGRVSAGLTLAVNGGSTGARLRIDEAATAERRARARPPAEGYGPGEVHPLGRLLKAPGTSADAGQGTA